MPSALDIARYILSKAAAEPDEPELMTHLRLQRVLYFVQGWALAYRGRAMFLDPVEAWSSGPIVRDVWTRFERFGNNPISLDALPPDSAPALAPDERGFVDSIWESYKRFSSTRLRDLVLREEPWRLARNAEPSRPDQMPVITHEMMLRSFLPRRDEHRRMTGISAEEMRQAEEDIKAGRTITLDELRRRMKHAI